MKLSNSYFFTKKENSKNEESNSANLLIRAGMIKKVGSGIFCFLPLGLRVFRKIENIISITWILDVFITLSIIANNIRLTITVDDGKPGIVALFQKLVIDLVNVFAGTVNSVNPCGIGKAVGIITGKP